jgi:hypothetical protein
VGESQPESETQTESRSRVGADGESLGTFRREFQLTVTVPALRLTGHGALWGTP